MTSENAVRFVRLIICGAAVLLVLGLLRIGTPVLTARCLAASDAAVVATVNNESIMKSELDGVILQYKRKTGKREITDKEKHRVLENLITRRLIIQQPSVQALKQDRDIIKNVKQYEEKIIIARFLNDQVGSRLTVTEDELKKYYKENRHRFSSPPKVKARHILLRTREEAEGVLKRLRKGEDFGKMAKEYSIDLPYALEGGSLGTIEKGAAAMPAMDKALFTLNVGEVSDIVKTHVGFHIFTVDEIKPASFRPFEEMKPEIEKVIMRQKEANALDEMAANLKKDADIRRY